MISKTITNNLIIKKHLDTSLKQKEILKVQSQVVKAVALDEDNMNVVADFMQGFEAPVFVSRLVNT